MSSALLAEPAVGPYELLPRFATPRDPGRRTFGGAVGKASAALRRRLMPWQQLVADVGGEVNDRGLFVYPLVVVTVQRQAGKTQLDLAQSVQRCLQAPRRFVWHTAQTGQDARAKWGELVDEVTTSPLAPLVAGKPKRTNGAEALTFVNGSSLRPHPPTRDALHGKQSDVNNVDEAWAHDEATGADLFQAITPTQLTRPGAQTWVWSTRGDASSTWFHGLIDRAYAGEPGIALFDFGIPDDADPTDLATIARYHPAYGHTVTMDSLRAAQVQLGDKPGEFARAYGNRQTGSRERILAVEPWQALRVVDELPAGRPGYGVAVAEDGSAGALVAAVVDAAGVVWIEVVEHRPGRAWLVERVKQLRDAGLGVAIERRGPAGPIADQLAGDELWQPRLEFPDAAWPAACQGMFDRVIPPKDAPADWAPTLRWRDHEALDTAADVAGRRKTSDGAWVWSRTWSTGDISPLEAGTLAAWLVGRAVEAERPGFDFG